MFVMGNIAARGAILGFSPLVGKRPAFSLPSTSKKRDHHDLFPAIVA